jgi:hypothetical protein
LRVYLPSGRPVCRQAYLLMGRLACLLAGVSVAIPLKIRLPRFPSSAKLAMTIIR